MILLDNLFDNVLVAPMSQGANELFVVSGYATSAMVFHHMQHAKQQGFELSINLLVGMCPNDGISNTNHQGFKTLVENDFQETLECSYIYKSPAVHSKVYAWLRDGHPICGFAGSANYTQNAFSKKQMEAMVLCDAESAYKYYMSMTQNSIYCTHNDVDEFVGINQEIQAKQQLIDSDKLPKHLSGFNYARVSLIDRHGNVPARSGLNWGQRPEEGRDPNQAYLSLRSEVYNTNFFPERKVHFTVLTDDKKTIICSRAQDAGKGIHTPHNNALLGEYFRNRLGLASGVLVTKEHLETYGRTDVIFYKIDDETYHMDFSV